MTRTQISGIKWMDKWVNLEGLRGNKAIEKHTGKVERDKDRRGEDLQAKTDEDKERGGKAEA